MPKTKKKPSKKPVEYETLERDSIGALKLIEELRLNINNISSLLIISFNNHGDADFGYTDPAILPFALAMIETLMKEDSDEKDSKKDLQ